MASGLRARASEARAIQARWREGKSKRRVTSKDSLFHHHHHPNFYDFFPRAIAPFTGIKPCEIGITQWALYEGVLSISPSTPSNIAPFVKEEFEEN